MYCNFQLATTYNSRFANLVSLLNNRTHNSGTGTDKALAYCQHSLNIATIYCQHTLAKETA